MWPYLDDFSLATYSRLTVTAVARFRVTSETMRKEVDAYKIVGLFLVLS